jgi:hypothetical protein
LTVPPDSDEKLSSLQQDFAQIKKELFASEERANKAEDDAHSAVKKSYESQTDTEEQNEKLKKEGEILEEQKRRLKF